MKKLKMVIPVSSALHYKLKYIATQEGRTLCGICQYLIRKKIERFETENGPIRLPEERTED